jgi:hypothetical protein
MAIRTYGMEDVGSRLSHLMDLHDLWSAAYQILIGGTYHPENEELETEMLEHALALLNNHIMHDYRPEVYEKTIDQLPKDPKEIT